MNRDKKRKKEIYKVIMARGIELEKKKPTSNQKQSYMHKVTQVILI